MKVSITYCQKNGEIEIWSHKPSFLNGNSGAVVFSGDLKGEKIIHIDENGKNVCDIPLGFDSIKVEINMADKRYGLDDSILKKIIDCITDGIGTRL